MKINRHTRLRGAAAARALTISLMLGSASAFATTAQAQQTVAQDTVHGQQPAKADEGAAGEIIVTAEKTKEVASKVPQALSVFSGAALAEQGVTNVTALQQIAPGLEVGSASHGVSITIRGVTTTDVTSKGDQDIVFDIDGIPIGRPQLMGLAFYDLDRVEVLRGPQGTLYGKSSTGGVINVITAKPTDQLDGSVSAELGNYNTRRATAMINIPVTDNFALRAAFNLNKRDGFLTPVLGATQALPNTEPNLGAEDNWSSRITGRLNFAGNGSLVVTGTFGHIGGATDANDAIYSRVLNGQGNGRFNIYYNPMVGGGGLDDNFANINAELNFDLGPVHVAYDGAHMWWHGEDDFDPSVNDVTDNGGYGWNEYSSHLKTDSHELRFSSANPGPLFWQIGANYYNEKNNESDLNWLTSAGAPVGDPSNGCPSLSSACNSPNPNIVGPTTHRAEGIFGQINYNVTPRLKLIGGLRYSDDKVTRKATIAAGQAPPGGFVDASGNPCGPGDACVGPAGSIVNDFGSNTTHAITWRAGAEYQITPHDMVYGSVSTGYKAGGFNDLNPAAPTSGPAPYQAEHVTAYELGFKGNVSRTVYFDSDIYYYDYSKYQITGAAFFAPNITGGAPVVLINTTVAPATLYGWESTLRWQATPNDTFSANLTLARGFYNNGPNAAEVGFIYNVPVYWGGKSLDHLPKAAATLSYEHRFHMADGGQIRFHVSSKISDGYYESDLGGSALNPISGPYYQAPKQYWQAAYTRTDAELGYTSPSKKLEVEVYVKNLENGVQIESAPTSLQPGYSSDGQQVRINLPRTFGVRLNLKY